MNESASPTNARKAQASARHRISGYCGYIPGLAFNTQVNTTEYADWELDARNGARFDPAKEPRAPQYTAGRNAPVEPLPERVAANWVRVSKGFAPEHANYTEKSYAPRSRVMGYNGYVPGMRHTHGVINSDYQNEEFFVRRHHILSPIESLDADTQVLRLSSPKDSRRHAEAVPKQGKSPSESERTQPRRSQSADSRRPFILPPDLMGQTPPSNPNASNEWLLRNDDRVVFTAQDYVAIPRICSYAAYRPGKKFVAG